MPGPIFVVNDSKIATYFNELLLTDEPSCRVNKGLKLKQICLQILRLRKRVGIERNSDEDALPVDKSSLFIIKNHALAAEQSLACIAIRLRARSELLGKLHDFFELHRSPLSWKVTALEEDDHQRQECLRIQKTLADRVGLEHIIEII